MKVSKAHYDRLKKRIDEVLSLYTSKEIQLSIREFQANPKLKNWRIAFMWAVYHQATTDESIQDMMREGKYLDAHIETALKKALYDLIYP